MVSSYSASDIEVLVGLEPVQKRPGMYTQTDNPNHLAQEVIDNGVDEVISGHASEITVTLHEDCSLSVLDDGRGIPVDIHQDEMIPAVELIMTRLHSGAKFSSKNYRHSGGLHGVGVSVVNALSKRLIVEIMRAGQLHRIEFVNGDVSQPLTIIGDVAKRCTGTKIRFWPNPKYFDSIDFDVRKLKQLMLAKAVLCTGLQLNYVDKTDPKKNESWQFEEGLQNYLHDQLNGSSAIPELPFVFHQNLEETVVDCAITWTPTSSQVVAKSFVNLIPTPQGGTHVNGFRIGIANALREFCEFRNLTPKAIKISVDDVWRQCNFILSVRMDNPQFQGQTKERLSTRRIGKILANMTKNVISLWLNQQVTVAEQIAKLAIANARQRKLASQSVKRRKTVLGPALPGKLADCTSTELQETELFLVEGDSAGGSAKQARNKETQAILPLRGKILNTWEIGSERVLASAEVNSIAVALGVDPGSSEVNGLRYGKVCILADADSDGAHIATLLCALFVRHFRVLVAAGHVHVAMPPLYRIDSGKDVHYALDDDELEQLKLQLKSTKRNTKITVQRFKGLGEMNPSQLKETTMDPSSRRLVRLEINGTATVDKKLDMLLAKKKAGARKVWLTRYGDQAII